MVTIITNMNWHTPYQITRKSLSLDNLDSQQALLWLNGAR